MNTLKGGEWRGDGSEKGFRKVKGYGDIAAVVAAIEAEQAEAKKLKSTA